VSANAPPAYGGKVREILICPNCGEEDSIDWKFDAWALFEITGVDADGALMKSADFTAQVFDDSIIECSSCGKSFEEEELARYLLKS
jgi:protein-arginine kinase activator protein McsA